MALMSRRCARHEREREPHGERGAERRQIEPRSGTGTEQRSAEQDAPALVAPKFATEQQRRGEAEHDAETERDEHALDHRKRRQGRAGQPGIEHRQARARQTSALARAVSAAKSASGPWAP